MLALAGCDSEPAESDGRGSSADSGLSTAGTANDTDPNESDEGSDSAQSDSNSNSNSASNSDSTPSGSGSGSGSSGSNQDESGDAPKFDVGEGDTDDVGGCVGGGDETGADANFSYIWIGNSPDGTVSKIDTETGQELGRYLTSPGSNSPSRTSVNQFGDVAVGNRGEAGSITKIAAQIEDCIEFNGTPGIQTSTGPDDVLPYGQDECVLWNTALASADYAHGPRAVAWEGGEFDEEACEFTIDNPRVWVSWHGAGNTIEIRRINGLTGQVADVAAAEGGGGRTYGGAVDGEGNFWVATRGGVDNLIFTDAETLDTTVYNVPQGDNYGMTVDKNGNPWVVGYNEGINHVYRLNVATGTFDDVAQSTQRYRGVQIDREGRAWIAGNIPCRLSLVDADNLAMIDDNIPVPGCVTPVGVSIDRDGFVWVVDQGTSQAYKMNPETYAVELTVSGLTSPYTYSDMTGAGLNLVINPPG